MSSERRPIKASAKDWRGNLRQNCLQRVKERRQEWLQVRRAQGQEQAKAAVSCELRALVSAEWQSCRSSGPAPSSPPPPLDPELLEALTRELYGAVVEEELRMIEEREAAAEAALREGAEEQEALRRQMEAGPASRPGVPPVLCPVCGRAWLVSLHGFISCPVDRFQLDARTEGTTLEHVGHNLAALHQAHHSSGCRGSLTFSVEDWPGPKCLMALCGTCDLMHVVL